MWFNEKVICTKCNTENAKGSNFCRGCGAPLNTKQKSTCPVCGKTLESGANFCEKCGAKLSVAPNVERTTSNSKEFSKNRVWERRPDDFAQRFEVSDLKGFFQKSVTIEQGTKAIFLQGGMYKGFLPAGYYNFDTLLDSIKSFFNLKLDDHTTIIIVDAAEVNIPFQFSEIELRDKNGVEISASGMLTLTLSDAKAFLENYLKHEGHVSLVDMENRLHAELLAYIQQIVSRYEVSELYGNPTLVKEIGATFQNQLNTTLQNKGLEIAYMNYIGFGEGAWKEVREAKRNLYITTQTLSAKYEERKVKRNLETEDSLGWLETNHTIDSKKQEYKQQFTRSEQDFKIEQESKDREHQRHQDDLDFQQDLKEIAALKELQARSKQQNIELEAMEKRYEVENLNSASIETLIFMAEDSKVAALAKLELAKRGVSLTPDQILAIQAGESAAVAEAIGKKYSAEEQKEFNRRMEDHYRESREHDDRVNEKNERIMETAINAMGQTATARATAQNPGTTTVVSGGLGTPVIVNGSGSQKKLTCPKCGADISEDSLFCPECGGRISN